jgi:penicillin amidase
VPRLRKWLIGSGIGLAAVALGLSCTGIWFVRRAWPTTDGIETAAGLNASVEVIRDPWGVPHIYAANEHDLFLAQGYVHAQDRLWQMDVNRRAASGTLSEVLGSAGLDMDRRQRQFGLRRVAEETWSALDGDSRAILEAYASGVNAFVESHRDHLPLEYTILRVEAEPWTPVDTLSWVNLMALRTTGYFREEIDRARIVARLGAQDAQQILPPRDDETPVIVPDADGGYREEQSIIERELAALDDWLRDPKPAWGSNSWVVDGGRTATGNPFLANDTHVDLGMPSIWYENGLHGGRFDSVGFTLPGVPLLLAGHNRRLAWGITTLRVDDQDTYAERIRNGGLTYRFVDEWRELEIVAERINVKGQSQPTLEMVVATEHGPIVETGADGNPLALRWTLYEGNESIRALVGLNLAEDWAEFRAALRHWQVPGLNFVYADVKGNIGYQAAARVPIRGPEHDGSLPVPGWTGEYEWQGFIPFEELPSAYNPPEGVIVTANNKIAPDDYPYLLSATWSPGYRARRITDLLSGSDRLTAEDMERIQTDTYSLHAEAVLPYLLAVEPRDELESAAMELLRAWNLRFDVDSVGASIYEVWYRFMILNTLGDEVGRDPAVVFTLTSRPQWLVDVITDANSAWFDDGRTPAVETRDEIIHRSLADATAWLATANGRDPQDWAWGQLHTATFVHTPFGQSGIGALEWLFNGGTWPAPGTLRTVNSSWYTEPFGAVFGTAQRMIVDVGNWDAMLAVNSTGQVAHLFHPNREDQTSLWSNMEYRPAFYRREAVMECAEATLTLVPQE